MGIEIGWQVNLNEDYSNWKTIRAHQYKTHFNSQDFKLHEIFGS
jgi:hypothetical protein